MRASLGSSSSAGARVWRRGHATPPPPTAFNSTARVGLALHGIRPASRGRQPERARAPCTLRLGRGWCADCEEWAVTAVLRRGSAPKDVSEASGRGRGMSLRARSLARWCRHGAEVEVRGQAAWLENVAGVSVVGSAAADPRHCGPRLLATGRGAAEDHRTRMSFCYVDESSGNGRILQCKVK